MQNALAPRGSTGADLQELIGDDLRLKRIKALLGATVAPADSQVREAFAQFNEKTEASVVRLTLADFLATVQVPDEEVKKLYDERKDSLTTDPLRKVKFVAFILPTTDKPLAGKERAEALGKLAKQAEDFSVDMTAKDAKLEDVAAKYGVKVEELKKIQRPGGVIVPPSW